MPGRAAGRALVQALYRNPRSALHAVGRMVLKAQAVRTTSSWVSVWRTACVSRSAAMEA